MRMRNTIARIGFAVSLLLPVISLAAPGATGVDPLAVGVAALEDGLYELAQKQFQEILSEDSGKSLSQEEMADVAVLLLRSLHAQKKLELMDALLKRGGG